MASLTLPLFGTSMILVNLLGRFTSNMFPLWACKMSRCCGWWGEEEGRERGGGRMTSCMIWRPAGFRYLLRGEFLGVGNLGPRSPLILILPRVSRCLLGARALFHTSWRQRERARQRESETEREREGGGGGKQGSGDIDHSTSRGAVFSDRHRW